MKAKPIDLSTVTAAQRKRFYEKIDRSGDGCWLWTAYTSKSGYGGFGIGNAKAGTQRSIRAHRLAWTLAHPNQILGPEDCVLHKCDTPSCCRPAHLFIGDSLANARDRDSKGRGADFRGEANGNAKLTDRDVLEIHKSSKIGRELATRFDVDDALISLIQRGKVWKHVVDNNSRKSKRRGDGHCMAKLNAAKVRRIRSSSELLTELASRYNVSVQLISQVIRRKIWQHVEGPTKDRRKNRARGERHSNAKLNAAKVRRIRSSNELLTELATRYGVVRSTIRNIKLRRTWAHVK